jgi:hypothetical protein
MRRAGNSGDLTLPFLIGEAHGEARRAERMPRGR